MSQNQAFSAVTDVQDLTFEEGTIRGRSLQTFPGLTPAVGAAPVNGPTGAKGQYFWAGTYVVQLDRGLTVDEVPHLCTFSNLGAQDMRCLAYGERVVVTWLNRKNVQIPVILEGTTLDFYNKQLLGNGFLLDPGERVTRSAIARTPGAVGAFPFADNQFDNPQSVPNANGSFDPNSAKVIKYPGAEVFYDKFGRLISLSRNPGNEFLITNGRTDSGQDTVISLTTIDAQDKYYSQITNDESQPANPDELMAPKPLNLFQYQFIKKPLQVTGDADPNRQVIRGILPRFDKWQFVPIVIRKYQANSDGLVVTPDTYATHQERQNTNGTSYGYVRTITDQGDSKMFVSRHYNGRVVGDLLMSVGGNTRFQVNPKFGAGTASNFSIDVLNDGTTVVNSAKKIVVTSAVNIFLGGESGAQSMVLGDYLKGLIDALYNAFVNWPVTPGDGGASLKAQLLAQFIPDYETAVPVGGAKYYLSTDQKVV